MQHIILVFADTQMANSTANVLNTAGFKVDKTFTSGTKALSYIMDVEKCLVICSFNLSDMSSLKLHEHMPAYCSMLLITKQYVDNCRDAGIITLQPPLNKMNFIRSVNMLLQNDIEWIESKYADKGTDRSEKDKLTIEKCKQLLILNYNITEPQAHSFLQKSSMNSGENIVMVANKIIIALSN